MEVGVEDGLERVLTLQQLDWFVEPPGPVQGPPGQEVVLWRGDMRD